MIHKLKKHFGDERPTTFDNESYLHYSFLTAYLKNKKILDIGCGLGFGCDYYIKNGAKKVVGIDNSIHAINYAKNSFKHPSLYFKKSDSIPKLNKEFDIVTAYEVIEHLKLQNIPKFLPTIKSVLKHTGICVISTPNKLITSPHTKKPTNPFHTIEFTPQQLLDLGKKTFKYNKLLGVSCINKSFLEYRKKNSGTFLKKWINFICSFKITHSILPYIPKILKNRITKQENISLSKNDFKIISKNIAMCDGLIMISSNKKIVLK